MKLMFPLVLCLLLFAALLHRSISAEDAVNGQQFSWTEVFTDAFIEFAADNVERQHIIVIHEQAKNIIVPWLQCTPIASQRCVNQRLIFVTCTENVHRVCSLEVPIARSHAGMAPSPLPDERTGHS